MKLVVLFILLLVAISASDAQIPTNGLVAHYSFNDGTGTDLTGTSNATFVGNVLKADDRFDNVGKAVHLDGKLSTYINLGTNGALKPTAGTISIWVNIDDLSNDGFGFSYNPIILAKNPNAPDVFMEAYSIYIDMIKKNLVAITTGTSPTNQKLISSQTPITFNEWHHIVLTYDDTKLALYLDTKEIATIDKGFTSKFSTDPVLIGNAINKTSSRAMLGAVDDIRIYNKVLSIAEIGELFKEENPVITPPVDEDDGESPCPAKWALANSNNSSLVIQPNGNIKKTNYDGNSKVESGGELASEEDGWMKFQIKDFGLKKNGKEGTVKIGAETNGHTYEFDIAPNKTKHWIIIDGTSTETFQATFKEGAIVRIKRVGNRLVLKQKVGDLQVTVATIKNIAPAGTKFYMKLNGLGATIAAAKMSFSLCVKTASLNVYAELKEILDANYYKTNGNVAYFYYKEEYRSGSLSYQVYDPFHRPVSATLQNLDPSSTPILNYKRYGTNRYQLTVNSLSSGIYNGKFHILEVTNDKGEKQYLRLKKE